MLSSDSAATPTRARNGVLAFALSLMAVAYLDRVCIATAAPAIRQDLQLDDAQMGWVFSAFTIAYALFEVPSGWLADRYGARIMLARIVIWWSAMTALTSVATGFLSLVIIRFLFGMGEAGALPSIARAYTRWLPARESGRAFGLAVMAGALGGALTQPLVVLLLGVVDWRTSFVIFGGVGLFWVAAWLWWFRDDPRQHPAVNAAELAVIGRPDLQHGAVPWGNLLRNPTMVAICAMYLAAIYGWYFYITWLPTYLLRARGFDLKQMGLLASLPLLMIAVGVLAGGWVSDPLTKRWGARYGRRAPALFGLPMASLSIVVAILTDSPLVAALALSAAAGFAALAVAPAWAVCLEIGGPHAGVVTGAMNMFGNLGGSLSPIVVGQCLERWGSWNIALASVAGFYGVAAVCWLFIDPARHIEVPD